jgi:transposase-like protein
MPEFKTKIVLEILEGNILASEIAAREEISHKTLSSWKQEFLKNAHKAFVNPNDDKKAKQELKEQQEREKELTSKVGVLMMENDYAPARRPDTRRVAFAKQKC